MGGRRQVSHAGNSASLNQLSVSVSPFHLPRNFLASYYPASKLHISISQNISVGEKSRKQNVGTEI